ncbi:DUF4270 family protein [Spirosoma utsteinense]|uniref:DUF4270 family protein n=1 Tax=Spirosoma utsteinense TaxID=2585773 RepID=A0ABR6W8I5_9BACT|nr:DUF4270 family protein [Spirosoma utsteinense]MBC3787201.1 hypothetical protein [Spirosoma utsteinense]MBC3792886.1 hypothetical protein [Spirosoma utsteinense]
MYKLSCIGLLLSGALLAACQSGDLDVGQAVISPFELQIQPIDSVTIQTATVLEPDTFVTSSDENILVGQWTDAQTGRLLARGFTSVDYVASELAGTTPTGLRLDSLVLELGYAFAYGDTATSFDLAVYPLREPLASSVYYNSSSVGYAATPLLQKTILLRPNSGTQQLRLRLPDALAQSFFDKLTGGAIRDATTFGEFWPGFAFTGQSAANSFVGFTTGTVSGLRLYYHATDINRTASSLQFPITAAHFSQLLNQRSGSALQALQNRTDIVSSTQTNASTYVAVGAALRTRIEFPYLGTLDKPEQFAGLNSAMLVVEPIRRDLRDNMPPPAQLALYQTNSQNELLSIVAGGSAGETPAVASYAYDPTALELVDAYSFDLTQYVNQIIRHETTNRPLLLTVPAGSADLQTLVRRITLGNGQRTTDRIRLRLFMTSGT